MRVAGFDVLRLVLSRDSLGSSSWRRITLDQAGDGERRGRWNRSERRRRRDDTRKRTPQVLKLSQHHDRLFARQWTMFPARAGSRRHPTASSSRKGETGPSELRAELIALYGGRDTSASGPPRRSIIDNHRLSRRIPEPSHYLGSR